MSSSTTEVFNKSGVESTMNKIGETFQEISSDYVNADQQMIENLTTPDGAMFGAGATKVLNAWDENSGTLEDFMTTFENWAALVSGMATQYADLETGTYKVKDGSPYSEDDIAKRARDFHTTALKTKAGITAFNTAQSDYYEKNKDKDYLQSYDNNGIAYTSVRRLENGKIVETKVYKDEQGNYIAEEEHWTWNDKDKKFERTTEYYSGGSIDTSGQYNHKGLNPITEEDFKKEYNKIKAASEAQTGSGNTGSEPQAAQTSVTVDTENRTAEYDGYTLSQENGKTYITDAEGNKYEVKYNQATGTYEYYKGDEVVPKKVADSLNDVMAKITEDDYAKGVVGATEGNTQYSIDKDGNLVVENPFGIGETNDITMEVKYDKNSNQPTEYTLKTKSGATITTLTPEEYNAIMNNNGTATVTENGKTVEFKVDTDNKKIIKTTSDNNGVVSMETASIGDDGKVTVSYKYRDAGTGELADIDKDQYKKLTDGGQEGHTYNYENGVFSDTYRDDKEHATITIEEVPNDDKTYKKTKKDGEEEATYTVDDTIVTEEQYKNVQRGKDVKGSSDGKDGPLTITTYKIENGTYTRTTDDGYTIETKREDSSGRTTYLKTKNKKTEESDEKYVNYVDEGTDNYSVDGTITRNGEEHKYSYKISEGRYSEITFDGVTVSQGELALLKEGEDVGVLANVRAGKADDAETSIEYSIKEGKYTEETYGSNHKLERTYQTERNENGDLEREIEVVYKDDGSKETSTETTYEKGKVKKIETVDFEERTKTTKIYENGKVKEIITIRYGEEDGSILSTTVTDGDGNPLKGGEGK